MSAFKRGLIFSLISAVIITLAFGVGYITQAFWGEKHRAFPLLDQAYDILVHHGLQTPPAAPALEHGMIRGMVQAYADPFTIFLEPPQNELESDSLQGSFGGIGVQLERDESGRVRLYPFPESPAYQVGIQDSDILLAVDGLEITSNTTMEKVQAAIRGPQGEQVTLTIARPPNFDLHTFAIIRESIPLPSVTWHLFSEEPRLGLIKVNLIAASTPGEIHDAALDLQSQGAIYFVLDLRDNGGGLVSTSVDIARLFLQEGMILQLQYRDQEVETYQVQQSGPLADLPLAVLVNQNTASAAEIIAGALQAHQRATLIGVPTFGKDTIQLVFTLQDGSSLHVTAARWWIPGLKTPIAGNGITPDILLHDDSPGLDPSLTAAMRYFFNSDE